MLVYYPNIGGDDGVGDRLRGLERVRRRVAIREIATFVPESEQYPEGVEYRFQYMDQDGNTVLRYDNFPGHPDVDRHHYHTPEGAFDDVEYTGLRDHVRAFHADVDALRSR